MQRKPLPIGIQNFREIREGGHYYVDKTQFALRLGTLSQRPPAIAHAANWRAN